MEDRIYFNIESRTGMVKMWRLKIRENEKEDDERIESENRELDGSWTYGFRRRTINHVKEERMIYRKKTRNDAVELLSLTSESLEMLQIRNGESGQKEGRKGKGGRTLRRDLWERHREDDEHKVK